MKPTTIALLFIIPLLVSCSEDICDPCSTAGDNRISFEMNFLEYSDNNFFIDDEYADSSLNIYNQYYGNLLPNVLIQYHVKEIEVYKTVNVIGTNSIIAKAYIDLPPRELSGKYSDSLRYNSVFVAGEEEAARFELLSEGKDYLFHPETGYITFLSPVKDNEAIAVAYKTRGQPEDVIYGEFIYDLINNSDSVAVLKLVKPVNLQSFFSKAWKLKMKNRYKLIPALGEATDIDLDIYLRKADGTETNSINGKRLLELFGLDKYNDSGMGPDGKFDNNINITYEQKPSEIIFPVLEPFGSNIPEELKDYRYDSIYDTSKGSLSLPSGYFIIKGKYNPI